MVKHGSLKVMNTDSINMVYEIQRLMGGERITYSFFHMVRKN